MYAYVDFHHTFMGIWWILILVAIIIIAIIIANTTYTSKSAEEILDERLAKGEISIKEYENIKRKIKK